MLSVNFKMAEKIANYSEWYVKINRIASTTWVESEVRLSKIDLRNKFILSAA